MANQPKVLIIDDEPDIRELYCSFLEDQDYYIDEAQNGQEAFQMASKTHYDVYVTDIMMPEMNGVEFMKVLKMIDPDAVVIIITGYDDMHYTREALEYGAFRYLTKPVNMKEFRAVVEMGLLERKKLFYSTPSDKLLRLKEKLNSNPELHQNVFDKMQNFLLNLEKLGTSYIELGGPGSHYHVWVRVRNKFAPLSNEKIFSQDEINIMILSALTNDELDTLLKHKSLKFNFEFAWEKVKYRYIFFTYFERGELVVGIKPTRRSIFNLEEQRIPAPAVSQILYKNDNSGLVLFTGAAGCGKSSLIDSLIDYNNRHYTGSIFILQESIEYYHESKKSMIRHIELSNDINDLVDGMDNCMALNPSLVVIDNLNSPEALDRALMLVDAGVLVYATMKTKSAMETINKVISMAPAGMNDQYLRHIANALNAIMCLHLLTNKNGKVIQAKEILINTTTVQNTILNNNISDIYAVLQQGKRYGMQALEQDLLFLHKQGVLTAEEAVDYANNQKQMVDMIKYQ